MATAFFAVRGSDSPIEVGRRVLWKPPFGLSRFHSVRGITSTYRRSEMKMPVKRVLAALASGALAAAASAQLSIVNNIPGTFLDISGTGTALGLGDDTLANITTTVGNSVFAAGTHRVANNGLVALSNTTAAGPFTNATIPATGTPVGLTAGAQYLAPYWDDFDSETGNVYWQEVGGTLYIQWHDRSHFPGPTTDHATLQVQIHSSGPALAQYVYSNIEGTPNWGGGLSATIGYVDGTSGDNSGNNIQHSFNMGGAVNNQTVLSIIPEPASLSLLALGGLALIRRR
jgi:hypothetical protein